MMRRRIVSWLLLFSAISVMLEMDITRKCCPGNTAFRRQAADHSLVKGGEHLQKKLFRFIVCIIFVLYILLINAR